MTNQDVKLGIISDPHLIENEEYRWDLFQQLRALWINHQFKHLVITGDLTERKDNHNSRLVNRIVTELNEFAEDILPEDGRILIDRGNHDGDDPDLPYFLFLDLLPKVVYFEHPMSWTDPEISRDLLFLPHSRNPQQDWEGLDLTDKIVFAHATVDGAFAENGMQMKSNIDSEFFRKAAIAFSGDIHRPQQVGPLIYVGSPYNVRYGDNFQGGAVILNTRTLFWERIPLQFPRKLTFNITSSEDLEIQVKEKITKENITDAMVKVRLHIDAINMHYWQKIQQECKNLVASHGYKWGGWEMVKDYMEAMPTPDQAKNQSIGFDEYCGQQQIEERLVKVGKKLLEECP